MKAFWTLIFEMEENLDTEKYGKPYFLVDGPRLNKNKEIPGGDAFEVMDLEKRIFAQSKADSSFFAVAAASIIAKVERDTFMTKLEESDPKYLWEKNKGYATSDHIEAIKKHGLTSHHRESFCKNFQTV
jgi:ribonuclease HII